MVNGRMDAHQLNVRYEVIITITMCSFQIFHVFTHILYRRRIQNEVV